ncbi:helix-turn-helix domain-containing protein [Haladaptatus salinisoli]|uniref:helix-turn-helix domain-containing protein n=1 Tax=Haladaptatus salinisoli TaxID=2884876 RepID=UPI001D0AE39E|nr:helix-turn-helix domain-containing protein [Haladaptatus salinisoli]
MTLIGRIEVGPPPGQEALKTVPDMVLHLEDIRSKEDEPWKFIFWASGDDFETYETALEADPAVASYKCLTQLTDRHLYRIVLSEGAQQKTPHPIIVEQDITIINLLMTSNREELLARFPSREALTSLRDACRERDRKFKLLNLYEENMVENDGGGSGRYGVTNAQREALLTALEKGYFSIPREIKMEIIADDLGISTAALSNRLRRGQETLLRHTLAQDSPI